MAASSSSALPGKYDVFINFGGVDSRWGFVSHLYNALRQKSINTFIYEKLERGQLLTAIRESRISLVVFSQNYAYSPCKLRELVEILQCNGTMNHIMVPIFYQVDPSDVRKLKGSFAKAFELHDNNSRAEIEEVQSWRSALKTATDICGWGSGGSDAELIEKIVEDVCVKLTHISPTSIEYDVFINFRGEDTRSGFVGHLYSALRQKSISTYIDAKALVKGDPLSKLMIAARESKISIVVLSENYAKSTWCLKELVEILESRVYNNQVVVPIFYEVDPSDFRNLPRVLEVAFDQHGCDSSAEEERRRRYAYKMTSNITGWVSKRFPGNEAEFIEDIVEDISRQLIRISSTSSEYDVFINFKGEDTRSGFVGHLYSALRQKSISTYTDAKALVKGDPLSKLMIAARESKISIVVLSENYAKSTWCLKELVEILESRVYNNQVVVPIFYEVDPSDFRNLPRVLEVAFDQHGCDSSAEEERRRRYAYKMTSNITGWVSKRFPGNEAEFIEDIVEDISRQLIRISST